MQTKEITTLAREYVQQVYNICAALLEEFHLTSKADLLNFRQYHQTGTFLHRGKSCRFVFQGEGCLVLSDALNIKWDFGYEDLWVGLDPWHLFYYIEDNRKLEAISFTGADILALFKDLTAQGQMKEIQGLYYFV